MSASRWRARDAWLATMVVGFVLMAVSLALRWWIGAWIALAIGLAFSAAFWRLHADAERERRRWHRTLDAMQAAIALWDRDDRLLFANADFKRVYALTDTQLAPGARFEQLLRERVAAGAVPEARGREDEWIAERLAQRRTDAPPPMLRQMPDGRWRRITEQRLANGSLLSCSVDVTDLVENERNLALARAEAEQAHRLLSAAIEAMPAAVELYDRDDRLTLFNRRMVRLYPHMAEQPVLGETFDTLVRRALAQGRVPEAVGREAEWLQARLADRGTRSEPRLQRAPDGTWTHIYETPVPGGGLVAVRLDATEIVRQRDDLRAARDAADASRATLRDALEAMPAGVEVYDEHDRLVVFNRRLAQMYPHVAEQMSLGQTFEALVRRSLALGMVREALGHEEDWLLGRLAQRQQSRGEAPLLQRVHDGRWMHIYETRGPGGNIVGVRLDVSDLVRQREELDAANAALERLSATDALTGLANRRRFDERLAEELQRARRHGTTLALLMVDVDHFKRYNDRHGHPEGDRALQAVAAVLARQARRPGELVARVGGEEFALLLPQSDAATARTVADRCGEAMATLALPHGDSPTAPHMTLSIGAAPWRAPQNAAALVARADAALYAAKANGRACCVVADEDTP